MKSRLLTVIVRYVFSLLLKILKSKSAFCFVFLIFLFLTPPATPPPQASWHSCKFSFTFFSCEVPGNGCSFLLPMLGLWPPLWPVLP